MYHFIMTSNRLVNMWRCSVFMRQCRLDPYDTSSLWHQSLTFILPRYYISYNYYGLSVYDLCLFWNYVNTFPNNCSYVKAHSRFNCWSGVSSSMLTDEQRIHRDVATNGIDVLWTAKLKSFVNYAQETPYSRTNTATWQRLLCYL